MFPVWQEEEEEDEDEDGGDLSPVANPTPPPAISLMSPKATQVAGFIRICEEKHRAKAKVCSLRRTPAQPSFVYVWGFA